MFEIKTLAHYLTELVYMRIFLVPIKKKKGKAVPLHAMEAHGGRGGIAPTHS
jgi:hypothetical protein